MNGKTSDNLKENFLYLFEKNRLDTFVNWPFNDDAVCSRKKMSEAGFVWSGNQKEIDIASCFLCQKTLDGWENNDNPWVEHRNHAPQCAFAKLGKRENDMTVEEFINIYHSMLEKKLENNLKTKKVIFKKLFDTQKSQFMEEFQK